jgi:hypothetical protein
MKEILIYGALVAAIIGASVPVIQGLQTSVSNAGTAINQEVTNQLNNITGSFGGGSAN